MLSLDTVRQQHAWYMTDGWGTLEDQVKQIQDRIDWLHNAGFHFLSTESGFSEFTHPDCTRMVAWMNATTQYTRSKYGKRTVIKAHISTVRSSFPCFGDDKQITDLIPFIGSNLPRVRRSHHRCPSLQL